MASQGFSNFEAHQIVFDFFLENKSGTLVFQPGGRKLFFEQGNLVFANSETPGEHFSDILVTMGVLDGDSLSQVRSGLGSGESLGKKLKELGLATPAQLAQALKQQITNIVDRVFSMDEGTCDVQENVLPARVPKLKIQVLALVIRTLTGMDTPAFLESLPKDQAVLRADLFDDRLTHAPLPAAYQPLVDHLQQNEGVTAEELAVALGWEQSLTDSLLYAMSLMGAISFAENDEDVTPLVGVDDTLPGQESEDEPEMDATLGEGFGDNPLDLSVPGGLGMENFAGDEEGEEEPLDLDVTVVDADDESDELLVEEDDEPGASFDDDTPLDLGHVDDTGDLDPPDDALSDLTDESLEISEADLSPLDDAIEDDEPEPFGDLAAAADVEDDEPEPFRELAPEADADDALSAEPFADLNPDLGGDEAEAGPFDDLAPDEEDAEDAFDGLDEDDEPAVADEELLSEGTPSLDDFALDGTNDEHSLDDDLSDNLDASLPDDDFDESDEEDQGIAFSNSFDDLEEADNEASLEDSFEDPLAADDDDTPHSLEAVAPESDLFQADDEPEDAPSLFDEDDEDEPASLFEEEEERQPSLFDEAEDDDMNLAENDEEDERDLFGQVDEDEDPASLFEEREEDSQPPFPGGYDADGAETRAVPMSEFGPPDAVGETQPMEIQTSSEEEESDYETSEMSTYPEPEKSRVPMLIAALLLVGALGYGAWYFLGGKAKPEPQQTARTEPPPKKPETQQETAGVDEPVTLPEETITDTDGPSPDSDDPDTSASENQDTVADATPPPSRRPEPRETQPETRTTPAPVKTEPNRNTSQASSAEASGDVTPFTGDVAAFSEESVSRFREEQKPYSIALMLACELSTVEEFLSNNSHEGIYVFPRDFNGRDCYTIAWGAFSNSVDAASERDNQLPENLRRYEGAWVKNFKNFL